MIAVIFGASFNICDRFLARYSGFWPEQDHHRPNTAWNLSRKAKEKKERKKKAKKEAIFRCLASKSKKTTFPILYETQSEP